MVRAVKGDVVTIPFPFSDLSGSKVRPALVVATMAGDDIILCQITSQAYGDPYSLLLDQHDFAKGSLPQTSYIRPNKLFTADSSIVIRIAGQLAPGKLGEVVAAIHSIIHNP